MSIPVIISVSPPDPDVQPKTYAESVSALGPLITGRIDETIATFVKGSSVPAVDDQDKVWFRFNTIGSFVGVYAFHLGVWVREEPIVSARFGIFTGDPTLYFDANGKGLKGAGPIAGDYWGWHLMNGLGGTQNWSNRFLIGGQMDNVDIVGFSGGWRTNVNGAPEAEGGVAEITLDADSAYTGNTFGRHDADGSTGDPSGPLYGSLGATNITVGNTDPEPISVVNPFRSVAYVQFTGYAD